LGDELIKRNDFVSCTDNFCLSGPIPGRGHIWSRRPTEIT
jgi:hypothetical protein